MKIIVTGSEGFVGRHVRRRLPRHAEVVRVDCMEPRVHRGAVPDASVIADFCSFVPESVLEDADILIHLAAQVGVADSMDDPDRYIDDNTNDTLYFFETLKCLDRPPRRVIVASSMSIYGDPETSEPVKEDHAVRPASIYGLTKFDQERIALMYGDVTGAEVAALRFFNIYGPGQALHNPYTGVLAIFSNALLRGEAPTVFEDGRQTRDFVYVEDVADVVASMAVASTATGVFNVATGTATAIEDVALKLASTLDVDIAPNITHETRAGDIRHCVGDSSRLRRALPEWSPRTLDEGLRAYALDLLTASSAPG